MEAMVEAASEAVAQTAVHVVVEVMEVEISEVSAASETHQRVEAHRLSSRDVVAAELHCLSRVRISTAF